jgi:nucleoside-diphosphate-sugar epimerase
VIVLTGGTGLIGGEWLRRLPARQTIVLTRRPEMVSRGMAVACDLGRPIDLDGSAVEYILHCAADIRFNAPLAESWAANVTATENLLQFARRCPRLRQLVFLSTVYAAGDCEGIVYEAPIAPAPSFFSNYERTKFEAEQVVFDAMRDIPIIVVRLSSVIGSRSGEVRQSNYFHQLLRLASLDVLPMIPARPDALVDLIPVDWAVDVIDYLRTDSAEGVFHLCAGPDRAMTLDGICELLELKTPRFGSLDECDTYYGSVGGRRAEVWKTVQCYLPHLGLRQAFDCRRCSEAVADSGIGWLPSAEFISRVVCGSLVS